MFGKLLGFFGINVASFGSQACLVVIWDEPKCPKSLIK